MIGIGKNNQINKIKIYWPGSGKNQNLFDLKTNQWHYIIESG
ncbi:MAG: hypothetical protein CM1200mP1_04470 [Candidatus Neomarinimicrobiota bacterium]|nr:MAG: hypothetical protein CM1200mP1_04470 [Candidatus Neomarinimicrobiota bacterium]